MVPVRNVHIRVFVDFVCRSKRWSRGWCRHERSGKLFYAVREMYVCTRFSIWMKRFVNGMISFSEWCVLGPGHVRTVLAILRILCELRRDTSVPQMDYILKLYSIRLRGHCHCHLRLQSNKAGLFTGTWCTLAVELLYFQRGTGGAMCRIWWLTVSGIWFLFILFEGKSVLCG